MFTPPSSTIRAHSPVTAHDQTAASPAWQILDSRQKVPDGYLDMTLQWRECDFPNPQNKTIALREGTNELSDLRELIGNWQRMRENLADFAPLHFAVNSENVTVCRVLLQLGANTEAVDEQEETPLHHAAESGHLELVNLLLQFGANFQPKGSSGQTPLHLACNENHGDVAIALVQAGADPYQCDNDGYTSMALADEELVEAMAIAASGTAHSQHLGGPREKCSAEDLPPPLECVPSEQGGNCAAGPEGRAHTTDNDAREWTRMLNSTPPVKIIAFASTLPPNQIQSLAQLAAEIGNYQLVGKLFELIPAAASPESAPAQASDAFAWELERAKFPPVGDKWKPADALFDHLLCRGGHLTALLNGLERLKSGDVSNTPPTDADGHRDLSWAHRLARKGKESNKSGESENTVDLTTRFNLLDEAGIKLVHPAVDKSPAWVALEANNQAALAALFNVANHPELEAQCLQVISSTGP